MRRRENNNKEVSLKLYGNNANSLGSKLESLEKIIKVQKPSVFFLQETKLGRAGRIRTPSSSNYTWYELHRTEKL